MATQDRSPSLLIGQQWSAWTELLSTIDKKDSDEDKYSTEKNASDSMKLGKNDMGLFGFCPARDEFTLVVCEKCNLLIKPQALKQHIESRHGPTNLSSLGNVPASALNSELGKKLLMPEPLKTSTAVTSSISTISSHRSSGSAAKLSSSGRPPTKASLKQIPSSVQDAPAPRLGVSMKISPVKAVKPGNRISPSSSNASGKSKAISSNPVVKVEKLPERLPPSASMASTTTDVTTASPTISSSVTESKPTSTTSTLPIFGKSESSKISTLVNGSLKTAVSLTTPSSMTFSSLFNMSPAAPSSLVVTTKTSTDTPISSRSLSSLVTMSTITKPIMIGPVMTVTSSTVSHFSQKPATTSTTTTSTSSKSSKVPKDQRKFLPCKDREYDANKHCGVITEKGIACTRSLTCKTHGLSLRRAVPGRCKPFDDLLKEHKAAKDASKAKSKAESQGQGDARAATSNRILVSPSAGSHPKGVPRPTTTVSVKDGKMTAATGLAVKQAMVASGLPAPAPTNSPQVKVPREHTNIFKTFTTTTVLPQAVTIKEEPLSKQSTLAKQGVSPSGEMPPSDFRDPSFLPHHPRAMAMCQFGGRLNDRSCFLFSRKTDYVRAAVQSALERHLNPPPHKKLCVESKLPKEAQLDMSSQDPYEFNLIDTSGGSSSGLNAVATVGGVVGKPLIKPKSKLPSSPVVAASSSLPSLHSSLPVLSAGGSVAFSSLSLSSSSSSSPTSSSVVSSLPLSSTPLSSSPSLTAIYPVSLNQSVSKAGSRSTARNRDNSLSGKSSDSNTSSGAVTPGKRKRSGSSSGGGGGGNASNANPSGGNNPSILVAAASVNGPITSSHSTLAAISSASGGITLNTVGELSQQHLGLTGLITSSTLSNHQTRNLIAIPSVNLANAAATLNQGKLNSTSCVNVGGNLHKNNSGYKDINLVLTGINSSSLVNGQYVNITSAQLADLTANQGQTLVLNNFPPTNNGNAGNTGTGTPLSSQTLAAAGNVSVTTGISQSSSGSSKPSKRSRSLGSRSHHSSGSSGGSASAKATAISHPLEGFKLIPSNNVIGPGTAIPPNTVLMDGSGLQGTAVLTSVTLAHGASPTLVAITTSSAGGTAHNNNNNNNVLNNQSQVFCGEGTAAQFTNAVLSNGLVGLPGHDKSVSAQRHISTSSATKTFLQHHHQNQQQHKSSHQPTLALAGNVLSGSASSPAQLAANPTTLFKPGSTFNLTKSVGGKLTVQPVSLTFPIVNQEGLAALTSATKSHHHQQQQQQQQLQQQQQQQQQQHTLLVAATSSGGIGVGHGMVEEVTSSPSAVRVGSSKTDLHLQAQISNTAAPGNVIS